MFIRSLSSMLNELVEKRASQGQYMVLYLSKDIRQNTYAFKLYDTIDPLSTLEIKNTV